MTAAGQQEEEAEEEQQQQQEHRPHLALQHHTPSPPQADLHPR